jgi:hypothetical protein
MRVRMSVEQRADPPLEIGEDSPPTILTVARGESMPTTLGDNEYVVTFKSVFELKQVNRAVLEKTIVINVHRSAMMDSAIELGYLGAIEDHIYLMARERSYGGHGIFARREVIAYANASATRMYPAPGYLMIMKSAAPDIPALIVDLCRAHRRLVSDRSRCGSF